MTSYSNENEAENLQNGDVHLAQIPDSGTVHLGTFGAIEVSDGSFFVFFALCHLFFDMSFF